MINDLSRTLKHLLSSVANSEPKVFPLLREVEIDFARPVKDFKPKPQGSICLFLYDIRENRELRSNEPFRVTRNGQPGVAPPPLRIDCSYLITAWPAETVGESRRTKLEIDRDTAADPDLLEHLMLSEVLQLLARYRTIPASSLQGKLVNPEQPVPLPLITAQAEGLNNISEFWTAIGSHLRPSLSVKATISIVALAKDEATAVSERSFKEKPMRIELSGFLRGDGNAPVPDARIAIAELGLSAISDRRGRYSFGPVPLGKYRISLNWKEGKALRRESTEIDVPSPTGSYDLFDAKAYDIAGQISHDQAPAADARVVIAGTGLDTASDKQGRFRFTRVPVGTYELRVSWKTADADLSKDAEITVPAAAGAYDVELKG